MARRHYHVVENTPGYLPDSDDPAIFTSRRAAERYASSLAQELRTMYLDHGEPYHLSGSARNGIIYGERDEADLGRVIEIIDCVEPDCLVVDAADA